MAEAKIGRPTAYTAAIGAEICRRLIEGDSLRAICEGEDMPAKSSVMKWLSENEQPEFSDHYARARELQGDTDADDIGDIARKAARGEIEPAAATAAINGLKWTAGKRHPKRYGDKLELNNNHGVQDSLGDLMKAIDGRSRQIPG